MGARFGLSSKVSRLAVLGLILTCWIGVGPNRSAHATSGTCMGKYPDIDMSDKKTGVLLDLSSASNPGLNGPGFVVVGSRFDDKIIGSAYDDTICGGNGNDEIFGGPGNDVIDGGRGDDVLHGDAGNDTIFGGPGDDTIEGGPGSDLLYEGDGRDFIYSTTTTAAPPTRSKAAPGTTCATSAPETRRRIASSRPAGGGLDRRRPTRADRVAGRPQAARRDGARLEIPNRPRPGGRHRDA